MSIEPKYLSRDIIRHEGLGSGLKLKLQADGTTDLNEYMFVFTDNIIARYLNTLDGELTFFPATFQSEEDSNGYVVTFRDIPECNTCGKDFDEAIEYARDAIDVCKDFYLDRPFPTPSTFQHGDVMIGVKL